MVENELISLIFFFQVHFVCHTDTSVINRVTKDLGHFSSRFETLLGRLFSKLALFLESM